MTQSLRVAVALLVLGLLLRIDTIVAQPQWPGYRAEEARDGSLLLVPEDRHRGPRPVLVLLPFTGGSAADLAQRWYPRSLPVHAAHRGMIVVLPGSAGSGDDYATGSAWTATLERYSAGIAALVNEAVSQHGGDPKRVVLAGYSMGGDLAWALMQRDPERYTGAVIMGSRSTYRARGALERLSQRGFRLFYFMADGEQTSRAEGAAAAQRAAQAAGLIPKTASAPGGHDPAPALIFADGIDYAFGFDAADRPALSSSRQPLSYDDDEDGASSSSSAMTQAEDDEEGDTGPDRRFREYRTRDPLAVLRAGGRHPLRPATTTARPESLPACDWEPFEDEENASGWGYRDGRGRVTVKPHFSNADAFEDDGLAYVWDDLEGGAGYLNCKGEYFSAYYELGVDQFSDDHLVRFSDFVLDHNSERVYGIGFLNRRGEVFLPAQYEYATSFCDGVAKVGSRCRIREDRSVLEVDVQCENWRYIDLRGQIVSRPKVDPDCGEWLAEPRFEESEWQD